MAIDENTRLDLRQAFEQLIGPDLAHAAMEAMPPLDYNQFATKTDLDNLGTSLRVDIAAVRTELKSDIAEVRTALKGDIAELKADVGELRTEFAGLESSMELRLAKNLRATMLTQVATMAAFAGLITGLG